MRSQLAIGRAPGHGMAARKLYVRFGPIVVFIGPFLPSVTVYHGMQTTARKFAMSASASSNLSLDDATLEQGCAGTAPTDIPLLIERLESLLYRYHVATKRSGSRAAAAALDDDPQ